ncbi:hypothetical protein [Burkholderia vietnamiensis]|uniref:hypothetical protein n=1 Tax=Burkholderia vietnamiensis TaxID=60552 RepID=UPI001FCA0FA4|nr:hypothetical protein [Burkholderia vietnamiensis]
MTTNENPAAVRVCAIADIQCSRGCGTGACKREGVTENSRADAQFLSATDAEYVRRFRQRDYACIIEWQEIAAVVRYICSLETRSPVEQPAAAPIARNDPAAVTRLKAICRKLGLESAFPDEVYSNPEGLFAIFGQIRSAIDRLTRSAPSPIVLHALRAAKQFIANGVELGYIRMPDSDCPDPAHEVSNLIDAAISSLSTAPSPADELAGLTDEQILDIGYKHFKPGHNVEAEAKFVAAVREILGESSHQPFGVWFSARLEEGTLDFHDRKCAEFVYESLTKARAASANETVAEGADALAHEVWSAAQRAPGEDIEDAVQRIAAILSRSHTAAAEAMAIPAGWKAMPPSATTAMRMAMAKAAAEYMRRTGGNSPDAIYEAGFAAAPQPAQAAMPVLTNAMRAVIANESGAYQSADDLYAALCAAADDERPAQADARVGLTDEQRTTIQHAADKLRTVWANHTGDKESRELCHKLEAILAGANHAE